MTLSGRPIATLIMVLMLGHGAAARAQDIQDAGNVQDSRGNSGASEVQNSAQAAVQTPRQPVGVTIDVAVSSIYNFRGLNVFGNTQSEQKLAFIPTLAYTIPNTGLTLSFTGFYQMTGDNKKAKVDAGAGHEHDFVVTWARGWFDNTLVFKAALTTYLYPFADKAAAGATCPVYLEPSVALSYSNVVDVSLTVAYFAGIQDGIKDFRYLYIRPYLSKTFKLTKRVSQLVGAGYGFKLFNDFDKMKDNVHDFAFDCETTVAVTDFFYIKPAVRVGWTNLAAKSASEEYMILGSLNLGFAF